jgi:flagellum-specific ATP synthase
MNLSNYLRDCREAVAAADPLVVSGRLTRVTGMVLEASGLRLAVGSCCTVLLPNGNSVEAEVVGFSEERLYLMPQNDVYGLTPGALVVPLVPGHGQPRMGGTPRPRRRAADQAKHVPVGAGLLGRVLDSAGRPLDQLGPLACERVVSLHNRPLNPLERAPIREVLDTGVRAINGSSPWGAASAWGCSRAAASARACCSA